MIGLRKETFSKNKQVSRMLSKAINKKSLWRTARQDSSQGVAAFLSNSKTKGKDKGKWKSSLGILEC